MGKYLRASMLRHESERLALGARMDKEFSSLDSQQVMATAFEVAVARWFEPGVDLRKISIFVADMRRAFGPDVPSLEAEALIRKALGEQVTTDDIAMRERVGTFILTLMTVADFRGREEVEVDSILTEAERAVFEQGLHPEAE